MNSILNLLSGWSALLIRPSVAAQLLLAIVFIGTHTAFLQPFLQRLWPRLSVVIPVLWFGILGLAITLIGWTGLPTGLAFLAWRAYGVWVALVFFRHALETRLSAYQVNRFFARLVYPLYVVILFANSVTLLSPLSELREISLFTLFGQRFSPDVVFVGILFPYFLIVGSELPIALLSRLLKKMLFLSESGTRALELILRYFVIGFGLVWMLSRIGLDANAVAAIAGGLSIGIGFGIKELISNFISGLWLLFEGSVRPGDILYVQGEPCEVRKLGLRAATLWRQRDNAELVVPNQEFFTTTTTTYTGTDHLRRGEVMVSAAYRHNPSQVLPLLLEAANSVPMVLKKPPPSVFLLQYGDSSIDYSIRYYVSDPLANLSAQSKISEAVWRIFADHDIEIPFPQRVLHGPQMPDPGLRPGGNPSVDSSLPSSG